MKKTINFIFEILFLIFFPISLEQIIRMLFGYYFIFGLIGILTAWVGLSILIKRGILILL